MERFLNLPIIARIVSLVFLLIMTGLCLGPYLFAQPTPEVRDFSTLELLLTTEELPPGWDPIVETEYVYVPNEGQLDNEQSVWRLVGEPDYVRMVEKIYRYPSDQKTIAKYKQWTGMNIPSNKDEEINFLEGYDLSRIHATKWDLGCENISPNEVWVYCGYVAQYEEFVVSFGVFVEVNGQKYMSSDDLYAVVMKIDKKISSYLGHVVFGVLVPLGEK
jgi:hypothetical protein